MINFGLQLATSDLVLFFYFVISEPKNSSSLVDFHIYMKHNFASLKINCCFFKNKLYDCRSNAFLAKTSNLRFSLSPFLLLQFIELLKTVKKIVKCRDSTPSKRRGC